MRPGSQPESSSRLCRSSPFVARSKTRSLEWERSRTLYSLGSLTRRGQPQNYVVSSPSGQHVVKFSLTKSCVRLGEDLVGWFDFSRAQCTCLQVRIPDPSSSVSVCVCLQRPVVFPFVRFLVCSRAARSNRWPLGARSLSGLEADTWALGTASRTLLGPPIPPFIDAGGRF